MEAKGEKMTAMIPKKCPICHQWFWHNIYDVDYVHQCRANGSADATRLIKNKKKYFPGRIITKIDKNHWNILGTKTQIPSKSIKSSSALRKILHESLPVDTYVEV